MNSYFWIGIIIIAVIVFTLIGYLVDKKIKKKNIETEPVDNSEVDDFFANIPVSNTNDDMPNMIMPSEDIKKDEEAIADVDMTIPNSDEVESLEPITNIDSEEDAPVLEPVEESIVPEDVQENISIPESEEPLVVPSFDLPENTDEKVESTEPPIGMAMFQEENNEQQEEVTERVEEDKTLSVPNENKVVEETAEDLWKF